MVWISVLGSQRQEQQAGHLNQYFVKKEIIDVLMSTSLASLKESSNGAAQKSLQSQELMASWNFNYSRMLVAQSSFNPVALGPYIYCPGGLVMTANDEYSWSTTQQRYSPKEDAWVYLPPFPSNPVSSYIVAPSPLSTNTPGLYYFQYDFIYFFNINSQQWSKTLWHNVSPRLAAAVTTVGDSIYLGGGMTVSSGLNNTTFFGQFHPDSGQWTVLPSLPVGRINLLSCSNDRQIFVIGGVFQIGENFTNYDRVDIFDLQSKTWTTSKSTILPFYPGQTMPLSVQGISYVNGLIYLFFAESLVQSYNPTVDQFKIIQVAHPSVDLGAGFGISSFESQTFLFGGFCAVSVEMSATTAEFVPES